MTAKQTAGWRKHEGNPVLGGKLGTCFDVAVLVETGGYRMYFSWRPKGSIAVVESADGIRWDEPRIVLAPNKATDWEGRINRPAVVKRDDGYHMWYTGQTAEKSFLGYATSPDGISWTRQGVQPVLSPEAKWEKVAVMCPHVIWDGQAKLFRMWYSGGEQYEPNAIGHATSPDGRTWTKHPANPVFGAEPANKWEAHKVTACQVVRQGGWHYMLYIGFRDEHRAQIGLARSRDGLTGWQRCPDNPILAPDARAWDGESCYKPFAVPDAPRRRWLLWYNGRRGSVEQIGLAVHDGEDLAWDAPAPAAAEAPRRGGPMLLDAGKLRRYVERFNADDEELYPQHVPNARAAEFLQANVPLLDCPDEDIERTYHFRWWTFRKHLKQTPDGFVVTEFLPKVSWSGKHNTISCPAGHRYYEGRWLHDAKYLDDYSVFWFRKGGEPRRYSFWAADAMWARHMVCPNKALLADLLPDLVANYQAWEKSRLGEAGLFWQIDDRDGMEVSIGGSGYRATINSYLYGDARAIARTARLAGDGKLAAEYDAKADRLRALVLERLWDDGAKFFKVLPHKGKDPKLADVRELHGYTPWYVHLPPAQKGYEVAWRQLADPNGFCAPFGPTTAERRHPRFAVSYQGHECQWNGPSWPFATSVTLTALANVLSDYEQSAVDKGVYFRALKTYAVSHRRTREDGGVVPWIDENLNPDTGDWLSRTRLKAWKDGTWNPGKGGRERGKDYNHSTFCDLVITGLIGLRPRDDDTVEVNPLLPDGTWEHFCLDNVLYHGRVLTILWDKTGKRYGKGPGLRVFADGRQIAAADRLTRVTGKLP